VGGGKKDRVADDGGELQAEGWNYSVDRLRDKKPRIGVSFNSQKRFGVVMLRDRDPKNPDAHKKLTYEADGGTNNTIVKIDGIEHRFGYTTGANKWLTVERKLEKPRIGWVSRMQFRDTKIVVTQHVEIVPSKSALLDTCLVYYTIRNNDKYQHKVGLRVMLDTYIGANDGVPFTVPGIDRLIDDKVELRGKKVPDYVEAIENPTDSKDPGTTARLALKGLKLPGITLTEPDMVRICRFPGPEARWDLVDKEGDVTAKDLVPMAGNPKDGDKPDSAVAIYWPYEDLEPGAKHVRHMAFTYGLGQLDIGDQLAVTAPPSASCSTA
jgi:hypothetical protein